eukprot:scaffold191_cov273-Chaetoceros_neogracile.AAC.28
MLASCLFLLVRRYPLSSVCYPLSAVCRLLPVLPVLPVLPRPALGQWIGGSGASPREIITNKQ